MDKIYLSGLSDLQWSKIECFFDTKRKRGHSIRLILNGIFYLLKTGCQWRMLPKGFPPHGTVYYYYQKWKAEGVLDEINDYLVGQARGKAPQQFVLTVNLSRLLIQAGSKGALMGARR